MTAGSEMAANPPAEGWEPTGTALQPAFLDAVSEGMSAAFIAYDRNDLVLFTSRQLLGFFPVPAHFLRHGTRLRDLLGAIFDTGVGQQRNAAKGVNPMSRDDWISQKIASHWRERYEEVERHGADRWIRFVKRRLPGGYGLCVISDISEEKKREEQWRADLERVQLTEDILDNLPFPLFVKDRNLSYVAVNKAFCEKHQVGADEVLGRRSADIFSPDVAARYEESDRHVMETGEMSVARHRQISRDGIERDVVSRKHRIGKPGRYFLVSTAQELPRDGGDVEEFNLASAVTVSNRQSYRRAYVPARAPGEEVRNPPATEAFLPESFSGKKVLIVTDDPAADTMAVKTLAKYGFEACSVHSDSELEAFLEVASSAGVELDLIIIDNQMGMRCLELGERYGITALVLDGFQMANEITFLVARHFNRVNRGAADGETTTADWEITTGEENGGLQVLVAEDNDINQIVFSQILEGLGYRYMIASTGDEAVRLWSEHRPQIVLMDISLPGFNGFEAARLIRQMEGDGLQTPIVGVLTQAFERDRSECARAGMNDVIMKPVSPDILEALFDKHLSLEVAQARG